VAATIRPLSREELKPDAAPPASTPASAPAAPKPMLVSRKPAARPEAVPIGSKTLDGSWDKRIRSGDLEPDRVLDLHGMSLDNAWNAIDRSLEQAIQRGHRVILLITGHHRPGAPPVERGKIRAAVHDWLAASRHAGAIAAVRGAHRRHGGGGSLYLVLRRQNGFRR
jgi:DNA-nicking Smr family endonuclease